jgi:hypothetical protein
VVFAYTNPFSLEFFPDLVTINASVFSYNRGRNFGAETQLPIDLGSSPVEADAAVDIGPGNELLEISNNELEEGRGRVANGIAFTTVFGTSADSENVVIKNNRIKEFRGSGIVAEADPTTVGMAKYSSIVGNDVDDNRKYGLDVEYADSANTNLSLFDNEAEGNYLFDCRDMSVASGTSGYTLGTHDTWYNNIGNLSYPTGLCTPGRRHDHD